MKNCPNCPLNDEPYVSPFGESPDVLVIGEAPGANEVVEGRPFCGRSGKVLQKMLSHYGFHSPWFSNVLKCRPPKNRDPRAKEIKLCSPKLLEEIQGFPATLPIITQGRFALKVFFPKANIKKVHGTMLGYYNEHPIYVMYHPAAGLHQPSLRWAIEQDWERCFGEVGKSTAAPLPPAQAIDTEATSINPHEAKLLVLGCYPKTPSRNLIFHNAKYDLNVLRRSIYAPRIEHMTQLWDTMYMAYHAGETELSLEGLCWRRLTCKIPVTKEEIKRYGSITAIPNLVAHVNAHAKATYRLWENLMAEDSSHTRAVVCDMALLVLLAEVESRGVQTDQAYLKNLEQKYLAKQQEYLVPGLNMNSNPQKAKLLFETLGLPPHHRTKGDKWSVDDETLQALRGQHPVVDQLIAYGDIQKLLSTYIHPAIGIERLHPSFDILTVTGRLNGHNPNLQNQPRGPEIRNIYVAREGYTLLAADLNQLEYRVAAMLSQDAAMLDLYRKGGDLHAETQKQIGLPRPETKTFNFASLYDSTDSNLSRETGVPLATIIPLRREWNEKYAGVTRWKEEIRQQAREVGYVETRLGRRRYLAEAQATGFEREGEKKAVNTPIQGTGAEHVKLMMLELQDLPMIIQVHDELVFECREEELPSITERVNQASAKAAEFLWDTDPIPFPCKFSKGQAWGSLEEINGVL